MINIKIEGESLEKILQWDEYTFYDLVLIDIPIVLNIGSAEVLGQFVVKNNILVIELAQIDGGGEGVLPTIHRVAKYIAELKNIFEINYIVHAINCAEPNMKLRSHLEKRGFLIKDIPNKGEAYFKSEKIKKKL
ncbi:hypothetical protein MNB_SV-13-1380 [hydrothermal vent metagenome]|uniref:N-acetyltransferase domain-containing protein n=1 Tax=hydrothermal vent metagenome TaxID=652676 RepID=A0A1W1D185_9ZZZZ